MHTTSLTKKLQITYPIIQAPMAGGITTPELVAAVSNAGGLGSLASGYMTPENLRETIQKTKQLTERPFAVNVFVPEDDEVHVSRDEIEEASKQLHPFYEELGMNHPELPSNVEEPFEALIEIIIEEKIPVVSFTFGIPSEKIITKLKETGAFVIGTATTVNEAIHLEKAGMDAIVAQGSEAGGHRATFSTSFEQALVGSMALIPQVVDHITVPVIAAGGIMDARGLLAAKVLGASAVQLGTAFLTCEESGTNPIYQETILESFEDSTVVTNVFSGKPARGIHNYFIEKMNDDDDIILPYPYQNALTQPLRKEAGKQQNIQFMSLWAGQGARLSQKTSAENFIKKLVHGYESLLATLR